MGFIVVKSYTAKSTTKISKAQTKADYVIKTAPTSPCKLLILPGFLNAYAHEQQVGYLVYAKC